MDECGCKREPGGWTLHRPGTCNRFHSVSETSSSCPSLESLTLDDRRLSQNRQKTRARKRLLDDEDTEDEQSRERVTPLSDSEYNGSRCPEDCLRCDSSMG